MDRIDALFNNLITWGANIALTVAAFFLMWGAFIYMSAGGSPRQMETGKSAMVHALIGLIIVLMARSIATGIRNAVGAP
ncbi:MAG: pilin [Chloroflexota bacterium]|nr:pilin [Chloroflexota bacterium]